MEQYERFRKEGWRSYEDGAKVVSYFIPKSRNNVDIKTTGVKIPVNRPQSVCEKPYDLTLVIRLMKDKMFTKKLTRTPSGTKKRLTPRRSFLDMKEYDKYTWISLMEEVRYCSRNGEDVILLSKDEISLLGG